MIFGLPDSFAKNIFAGPPPVILTGYWTEVCKVSNEWKDPHQNIGDEYLYPSDNDTPWSEIPPDPADIKRC